MRTIYKYPLQVDDESILILRGKVLSAGVQGGDIMVWAVYDDEAPERRVRISVRGTGHDLGTVDESTFIGTVFLHVLVFHVFANELN